MKMDLIIHHSDHTYTLHGSNLNYMEACTTGYEIMNNHPNVTHYTVKPSARH